VIGVVLGLKIQLREILVRIVLTVARWVIEHLSETADEME